MIHTSVLQVTQRSQDTYTATYRQHKVICPWLGANLHCISEHSTESALLPIMTAPSVSPTCPNAPFSPPHFPSKPSLSIKSMYGQVHVMGEMYNILKEIGRKEWKAPPSVGITVEEFREHFEKNVGKEV